MRYFKRIFAFLLCLTALFGTMALPVRAAGNTLTISYNYNGTPMEGVEFQVYQVAAMESGALKALPAFEEILHDALKYADAGIWADAAEELEAAINWKNVGKATADKDGKAVFTGLADGLYVVKSTRTVAGGYVYTTAAALVTLPQSGNSGSGTLDIRMKAGREPVVGKLTVVKLWKDGCHPARRPKSITVRLLCDGELYDTVTLPQKGKWEYVWEDLDMSRTWTVEEDRVTGYKDPEYSRKDNVITITNACNRPGSHHPPRLPQTGQLWWPVPVLFAAGLLLVILGLVRRREDDYEER